MAVISIYGTMEPGLYRNMTITDKQGKGHNVPVIIVKEVTKKEYINFLYSQSCMVPRDINEDTRLHFYEVRMD